MNKKVIKNIFFYGIGDFIVTGITAFLFIPLYIKYLSPQEYGILGILNNNTTLFTYIFQFGIISAFSRIYFIRKGVNKEKAYTWNIIYMHLCISLMLFIIYYFFNSLILDSLSPTITDKKLLVYPIAMAFLTFLPALYYIYLRVEEKASIFVRYQIVNVVLFSIFIFSTLFFYEINLPTILLSFIVTNCIMWGIVLFKFSASFSFSFDIKDLTDTIKFSFPIFVSYIAYFFISKYSIIILQKHISLENIGLFSLSHQIASIPSLITIAITKASQPYLFSSKSDDELKLRAIKFDSSYKLIMIWLVGSMIFSVDIIFNKFLPVSYYPAHNVAKYLLLISLIYNFSIVENSILLYYMKSKIILIITITGSILNIVLCNILVYKYSINGILISMLIAFSVNFLLDIYFSAKHFKLKYDVKSIIVCAFIIISYLIISSDNYPSLNKYSFLYSIFGFLILTIIICALLNKLNRGSIKTIYNI